MPAARVRLVGASRRRKSVVQTAATIAAAEDAVLSNRGSLGRFVEQHSLAWDLVFGALAVVYLVLGINADAGNTPSTVALAVLALIFLGEFAARLYDAPNRYVYVRHHWLDLVSAIPLVGGLRSLRLLRLLRLGAALRVLSTAEDAARRHGGGRHSFWYLGPALAVIWFSAATAYYVLESGVNHSVHSFGDALYWAFATASTVGYGAPEPVTTGGHVVAGLLVLVSIGLVGIISSRLVVAWLGNDDGFEGADPVHERLDDIERALQRIELMMQSLHKGTDSDGSAVNPAGSDSQAVA